MMLAGKDQIIDNDATKHWLTQVGSSHVTLHQYPDAQHTLEFEPQPEIFVNDLIRWLNGVCDGAPRRNLSKSNIAYGCV